MTALPTTAAQRVAPRPLFVAGALAIVYVVWGSTYLAIRVMVVDMPALLSAGARFVLAGALLAAVLVGRSGVRRLAASRAQLLGCATLGLLLPVLGNGLVTVAEKLGASSGLAALMVASVPLWVMVFRAVTGDPPGVVTVTGVLLGFGGLVWLIAASGLEGSLPLLAAVLLVVAPLCWSLGSWSQPRLALPRDPFVTTTYEMLFGGVFLRAAGRAAGERLGSVSSYALSSWLAWGYLVVFGSLVAFTAYVWLLNAAPVSLVATYAYVNPVVAVFLGWLVLAEPLTAPIVLGGAVVVAAVAVVVSAERRPRRRLIGRSPRHDTLGPVAPRPDGSERVTALSTDGPAPPAGR